MKQEAPTIREYIMELQAHGQRTRDMINEIIGKMDMEELQRTAEDDLIKSDPKIQR